MREIREKNLGTDVIRNYPLRLAAVLISSLLLVGCGGDKDPDVGDGDNPEEDNKPKPAAFTVDDVKRIVATDIDDYERSDANVTREHAVYRYGKIEPTAGGAKLTAMVTIGTCEDPTIGFSLDPANTMNAAMVKQAKDSMAGRNMENPVAELETIELDGGRKALCFFQEGYAEKETDGGTSRESSRSMLVRYHDGGNGIVIQVTASLGGPLESKEHFEKAMTKEDALGVVRDIFAALGDNFK